MHSGSCNPLCTKSAISFAVTLFVLGCGAGADLEKPRTAVESFLDRWKNGETPRQGAGADTEIADPDWEAGYRLLDFKVTEVSAQPQQGPRVVVVLSLQNRAGKKMNKEVAYEVILHDKVRIGRDAFHVGK
jgi:hypothetical protein